MLVNFPNANNAALLIEGLRRIQESGGEGNFVIFTADQEANIFIQFAGQNGDVDLYGEAVANDYIKKGHKVPKDKLLLLESLGWDTQPSPNYSQLWQAKTNVDREKVAEIVLKTLEQVYGVDISQPLEMKLNLE